MKHWLNAWTTRYGVVMALLALAIVFSACTINKTLTDEEVATATYTSARSSFNNFFEAYLNHRDVVAAQGTAADLAELKSTFEPWFKRGAKSLDLWKTLLGTPQAEEVAAQVTDIITEIMNELINRGVI